MSMLENKQFVVTKNRFNNPTKIQKSYSCIQLRQNLKSLNVESELFTNFAKSMGGNKYKLVKDIWEKHNKHLDITDECMEADEIINNKAKIDRLRNIITQNTGRVFTNNDIVTSVYKFKHKEDKEIQFYFFYDGKVLNLLLVDIFHLGITALKNGQEVAERQYLINKKNKCCLSNITK